MTRLWCDRTTRLRLHRNMWRDCRLVIDMLHACVKTKQLKTTLWHTCVKTKKLKTNFNCFTYCPQACQFVANNVLSIFSVNVVWGQSRILVSKQCRHAYVRSKQLITVFIRFDASNLDYTVTTARLRDTGRGIWLCQNNAGTLMW
jgi:hypothetical protein